MLKGFVENLDRRLLWRLLKENFRKHAAWYAIATGSMLVVAAMTALSAWIMRDIVNEMVVGQNVNRVFTIAAAVCGIFFLKGAATFVQGYYLSRAGNSIVAEQQRKIYYRLLEQGVAFFQNVPSSDILIRVTHNAHAARGVIDTVVTSFVRELFTLIGLVAVMIAQQPVLALASLSVGPLALFGVRKLVGRVRKFMTMELASITTLIQTLQETSTGIRVVKAFALEDVLRRRMEKAVKDVERLANRIATLESATSPIMETLGGLAIAGMIALGGILVLRQGQTPGELMSFITALLLAYEPAKRLARMRIGIEAGMVGVRQMFELLDRPVILKQRPDAVALRPGPGSIRFKDVDFAYQDGHPVLHKLNVHFPPGKKTALVGPSGGGKSTIVNLIMRFYDPTSGSIEIDGFDIRGVTFASLRERIAYVGQDTFLFAGTVKFNIGLGRNGASDEEIVAAARAANAHDFIVKLPQGYDTDVGENGGNLSGGQKQRLTIARAMLRDSEILILDEPTSALDLESEALVRDALQRLTEGRTTIIIAHRLSTIANADHIVVVDNGRIVEEGPHEELLSGSSGLYRRLHEYQSQPVEDRKSVEPGTLA
jgi:ATP-binding cassette subfamily B protein